MDDEYYFSAYTNNRCENDDGVVVVVIHNNQIGGRGTTKTMSNLTNLIWMRVVTMEEEMVVVVD